VIVAAAILTVELLKFGTPHRAIMPALQVAAERAGAKVVCTDTYQGKSDVLLLWGPGHPTRVEPMRKQSARGGHTIAIDLAYWDRHRKLRFSIDAPHPQAWVMRRDWPSDRRAADRITVTNVWNPSGPVVIAGLGAKAMVQYGSAVHDWEHAMIRRCQKVGKRVVYRPKRPEYASPNGVERNDRGSIDDALTGASLLATWHSNTAVDAIRMGVPVVCRDGAAAAVCPSELPAFGVPQPLDPAVRERFLNNLAYFQWAPEEARHAWRWITDVLAC
jgi:hypothetical protein